MQQPTRALPDNSGATAFTSDVLSMGFNPQFQQNPYALWMNQPEVGLTNIPKGTPPNFTCIHPARGIPSPGMIPYPGIQNCTNVTEPRGPHSNGSESDSGESGTSSRANNSPPPAIDTQQQISANPFFYAPTPSAMPLGTVDPMMTLTNSFDSLALSHFLALNGGIPNAHMMRNQLQQATPNMPLVNGCFPNVNNSNGISPNKFGQYQSNMRQNKESLPQGVENGLSQGMSQIPTNNGRDFRDTVRRSPSHRERDYSRNMAEAQMHSRNGKNFRRRGPERQPKQRRFKCGRKYGYRSKQNKIDEVLENLKKKFEAEGKLVPENHGIRGPTVGRVHCKKWKSLNKIEEACDRAIADSRIETVQISTPLSMKNKFQKKGFLVYWECQTEQQLEYLMQIFKSYDDRDENGDYIYDEFQKISVALQNVEEQKDEGDQHESDKMGYQIVKDDAPPVVPSLSVMA